MNSPLIQLMLVQFREFVREPGVLFWTIGFPIILAGVLGLAFLNQAEPVRNIGVVDASDAVIGKLKQLTRTQDSLREATGRGDIPSFRFTPLSHDQAIIRMKRGELAMIIKQSAADSLRFQYDPNNSDAKLTLLLLENTLLAGNAPPQNFTREIITSQGSRYIDFLIPGLISLGIMNSCVWGIGWNMIELRMKKLMRRIVATPMRKSLFLFAQMLTRVLLLVVEISLLYTFAHFVFGITVQGSWLALLLVFLSGTWAFSGVSILMSSRTANTQIANGLINAVTLPMTILSGIFFSYQGFPAWAITIIEMFPLTMLANSIRAIFNEGAQLAQVWPQVLAMGGIGTVLFVVGLRVYKWY